MKLAIVDYKSGNISSVVNSFKEVAKDRVDISVTSDVSVIKSSDKLVLPGQGSFKSCIDALNNINGLVDTLKEFATNKKKPLLGICVGLQILSKYNRSCRAGESEVRAISMGGSDNF